VSVPAARDAGPIPPADSPRAAAAPPDAPIAGDRDVHDALWSAAPSVTSDGALIFMPYSSSDGARGEPNLVFEVWNRRAERVQRQVIKDVDQCDAHQQQPSTWSPCPPDAASSVADQEQAGTKLLEQLQRRGLHPFSSVTPEPGSPTHMAYTSAGDAAPNVAFDLASNGTLTITPRRHAAIQRRNPAWRTKPTSAQARRLQARTDDGQDACFNPAELRRAFVDLPRRAVIVMIGYRGNDTCWEPDDDYTVVTW
jgi:hypothetical protein